MAKQLDLFNPLAADIAVAVSPTLSVTVQTPADAQGAIVAGKRLKELRNAVEKTRKSLVGPLNDQVKLINDYAKRILAPLDKAETHLQMVLGQFEKEQEQRRAEERRKLEEARERAEADAEAARLAEIARVEAATTRAARAATLFGEAPPDAGELLRRQAEIDAEAERARLIRDAEFKEQAWDIQNQRVKNARKVWKFEVTDPSAVPRAFLMVNESAIRAAVNKGERIPGVRSWQDTAINFGAKTSIAIAAIESERSED